jgi:F-type H+-transporting ATPase subunit delta
MKKLNAKQYARLLYLLTEGKPKAELPKLIHGFGELLARRHQLNLKDRIIAEYDNHVQAESGQYRAEVVSAQPLSNETKKDLVASLQKTFGCQVEIAEKIDSAIIGGFVVQVKDTVIDASLRRQLQSLKYRLVNS